MVTLNAWEGSRRFGVALAVRCDDALNVIYKAVIIAQVLHAIPA